MADLYHYVVRVDTHATMHSYAFVGEPSGALVDQAIFSTTPAGSRRTRGWIGRRTGGDLERRS